MVTISTKYWRHNNKIIQDTHRLLCELRTLVFLNSGNSILPDSYQRRVDDIIKRIEEVGKKE